MDNTDFTDISKLFEIPAIFRILLEDSKNLKRAKDQQMLTKLRSYIKELCTCLQNQVKAQKEKKLSENDILEYFKDHEQERMIFYGLLKQHLRVLDALRPDILASYEYYKKFLKLCEKDKNEYRLIRQVDKSYAYALFTKDHLEKLGLN